MHPINLTQVLIIPLQRGHHELPLYRQICTRVREAILCGTLLPGSRLPSSRDFSAELSISRGTIELAYSHLLSEGYVVSRGAAGMLVNPDLNVAVLKISSKIVRSDYPQISELTISSNCYEKPIPFQLGLPALDAFPRKLWSRLAVRRARAMSLKGMLMPPVSGYLPLRTAIANHLALFRGISCTPEQIFVTTGLQASLKLIAHTLLHHHDAVWIEDPGYFRARDVVQLAGARLVPVPVDNQGLVVSEGKKSCDNASLAYTTPSHQSPLGVTMSLPRRIELLEWASKNDAWVVEDDYDGEFRYDGRPLPTLYGLDATGRVLYAGSFSKVLFPGLCLGYLVVPEAERNHFERIADILTLNPAPLNQSIAADFITQGHFARHIRRMRQLYTERRAAFVAALSSECGEWLKVDPQAAGLYIVARLLAHGDDEKISKHLLSQKLAAQPLSRFSIDFCPYPALLLGFTNIPTDTATKFARLLRNALQSYQDTEQIRRPSEPLDIN